MDNGLPKENPMLFICGPLFLGFVGELHCLLVAPEFYICLHFFLLLGMIMREWTGQMEISPLSLSLTLVWNHE